jgi:hypothetical protein
VGGVVSPILMNLFMHYTFDQWMKRTYPQCPFARYADDCVPRTHGLMVGHGDAAHKMREGPSKPACRSRLQTTLSCVD